LYYSISFGTNQYVISHAHQVSVVDANGQIALTYGSTTAGSAAGQLNTSRCLVQVKSGRILVADRCNNRLMILNASLNDARQLQLPSDCSLNQPFALYLDESRGRLYVGEYGGCRVLVFDGMYNIGDIL
jgi:hypothetical protein